MVNVPETRTITLEEWMLNPPESTEWVDGKLIEKYPLEWVDGEKPRMALKHSRTQSRLNRYWGDYMASSGQGGEVYVEASCRTGKQGRYPEVAYLTPELVTQFGDFAVLPQSFPLIAEVASPTDVAEELFAKAQEYLESGCEEVWLVFPESHCVLVRTQNQLLGFIGGDVVKTQKVLPGFSVAIAELFA